MSQRGHPFPGHGPKFKPKDVGGAVGQMFHKMMEQDPITDWRPGKRSQSFRDRYDNIKWDREEKDGE